MCVCVRACVCHHLHISKTTQPNFPKFFLHVTCGHGSVLLGQRSDMLCTSGFLYDTPSSVYEKLTSSTKPEVLNISQRRQRKTEPTTRGEKHDRVWFLRYTSGQQTDRHTKSSQHFSPGEVTNRTHRVGALVSRPRQSQPRIALVYGADPVRRAGHLHAYFPSSLRP